jgi:hypothetical protein
MLKDQIFQLLLQYTLTEVLKVENISVYVSVDGTRIRNKINTHRKNAKMLS